MTRPLLIRSGKYQYDGLRTDRVGVPGTATDSALPDYVVALAVRVASKARSVQTNDSCI